MINQKAPQIAPLLQDEEELARYFTRRSYRGAIVKVSRLNEGEWICLQGDAAHSVLPPVGEGINSGLEDSLILWECLRAKPESTFSEYNSRRLADSHALYEYAYYLNEIPWFSGEKVSRGLFMVLNGVFTKKTINNELFGPMGLQRKPYSEIIASWRFQKNCIINIVRFIVYPIALVLEIVFSPITLSKYLYRNCCAKK